jgi:small subunit ribosomal protein S15e
MTSVDKKDKQFNKNSFRGLTIEQLEKLTLRVSLTCSEPAFAAASVEVHF